MIRTEVIIDEQRCHGCGNCVLFCPRECLAISGGNYSPLGYKLPVVTNPERCNACGLCSQMCPHWAIEVYLSVDSEGEPVVREKVAGWPRLAKNPPLANCPGCQHPLVGRIVTEVLDELGVDGRAVALDAISCASSSAFGVGFGRMFSDHEKPCTVATMTKSAQPNALVFLVQDDLRIPTTADGFLSALIHGEKFTMIMCTDVNCGAGRRHLAPVTSITAHDSREIVAQGYPMRTAELVATFRGVAYSARGAITCPDAYQRTKSLVRTAFRKQMDNVGFSFVEVLCACTACEWTLTAGDCLKWVNERIMADLPLGEFKNVDQVEYKVDSITVGFDLQPMG
jgi:2-oxoglutarate ferredoxin oxidoreductase subunit beta